MRLRSILLCAAIACAPPEEAPGLDAGPVDAGAADAGEPDAGEPFASRVEPLPEAVRADMTGKSWRSTCPVGLDALSLVTLAYRDFDGVRREGELVVATEVADDVVSAFKGIYEASFPIARMERVDTFDASDAASMAANNTSAFNCRKISGTSSWSLHSYGTAIDLNPLQNPWVQRGVFDPPGGAEFADRSDVRPGMIVADGPVKAAFDAIGWGWGGEWRTPKDYQHFSREGW